MVLIDTHTHLFDEQLLPDIQEVILRAKQQGIIACVLPNVDLDTLPAMLQLFEQHPQFCFPTLGLHPCSVKENYLTILQTMKDYSTQYNFVAIGEAGLDFYWDKTFIKEQEEALRIQCQWAIEWNLPIILHTREAMDATIKIVKEFKSSKLKGVFHCFTGSYEQAKEIIKLDFMLGIGGVVTYKNTKLPETLAKIPLDYIVLETDSPYLTPVPFRGKRNESAYLTFVLEKLAEIYQKDKEEVSAITSQNAKRLFPFPNTQITA